MKAVHTALDELQSTQRMLQGLSHQMMDTYGNISVDALDYLGPSHISQGRWFKEGFRIGDSSFGHMIWLRALLEKRRASFDLTLVGSDSAQELW